MMQPTDEERARLEELAQAMNLTAPVVRRHHELLAESKQILDAIRARAEALLPPLEPFVPGCTDPELARLETDWHRATDIHQRNRLAIEIIKITNLLYDQQGEKVAKVDSERVDPYNEYNQEAQYLRNLARQHFNI